MKRIASNVLIAIISAATTFFLIEYSSTHNIEKEAIQETSSYATLTNNEAAPAINVKPYKTQAPFSIDFVETSKRVTKSVVSIMTFNSQGYPVGTGSGVIYTTDGYIITNNHVVDKSNKVEVRLSDKRTYTARIVGKDPTTDLAVLKVNANDLPNIYLADSDRVEVGQWVLAVGNPFNLSSTVTAGIISAKGRNLDIIQGRYSIESFLQTDAVVNPGNSGGALVNVDGNVVGINTAILTETGSYEGYAFAIPSNLVRKVVEDLKTYGKVQRALLGVSILDINETRARQLSLPYVGGVLISETFEGGSAYKNGIEAGDVILKVNGRRINAVSELQERVAQYRPGEKIDLQLFRNGRILNKDNVVLQGLNYQSKEP
ncbi:MAG: trypsin-like peptidase domain-containing protein [Bacteroidota bacterium]